MREWLESLSAEAQEALGGELLEVLRRRGALSRAAAAEENIPAQMQGGFTPAEMAEMGLHNMEWRESETMGAAAGERAFLETFASGAEALMHRAEERTVGEDSLEELSRRLEREDRRYDNGFPVNA